MVRARAVGDEVQGGVLRTDNPEGLGVGGHRRGGLGWDDVAASEREERHSRSESRRRDVVRRAAQPSGNECEDGICVFNSHVRFTCSVQCVRFGCTARL